MSVVEYSPPERSWLTLMVPAAELAQQIAGTEFVPKSMRNSPGAIAAAILFGDEVGFGPMQSLAKIAVIDGKPALAAEAQRALILRAGHEIWIEESSVTKVTMCGRRKNSEQITRITWTLDDAKRANLAGRPSWRMYPRQMLTARATAELARAVFADAVGGLAAIEELDEPGSGDAGSLENGAETAPKRTRRRSQTALAPSASAGPVEAQPGPPLPGELVEGEFGGTPEPSPAPDEGGVPISPSVPAAVGTDSPDTPPTYPSTKPTTRQVKNLNRLVGSLREEGFITTENLWAASANLRHLEVEGMITLLGGRDEEGRLHWSPLRDSLDRGEASNLIDRLQRLEEHVGGGE